jgi:hypothetical protein
MLSLIIVLSSCALMIYSHWRLSKAKLCDPRIEPLMNVIVMMSKERREEHAEFERLTKIVSRLQTRVEALEAGEP